MVLSLKYIFVVIVCVVFTMPVHSMVRTDQIMQYSPQGKSLCKTGFRKRMYSKTHPSPQAKRTRQLAAIAPIDMAMLQLLQAAKEEQQNKEKYEVVQGSIALHPGGL